MISTFVSHASEELTQANALVKVLEANGHRCFLASRDLPPGSNFAEEIPRKIEEAKSFVLVYSANAAKSNNVAVEISLAFQSEKKLFPIRIDDHQEQGQWQYFLAIAQWIEAKPPKSIEAAARQLLEHMPRVGEIAGAVSTPGRPAARTARPTKLIEPHRVCAELTIAEFQKTKLGREIDRAQQDLTKTQHEYRAAEIHEIELAARVKQLADSLEEARDARANTKAELNRLAERRTALEHRLDQLRAEREPAARALRSLQMTFEHCRDKESVVARELFMAGSQLPYLRREVLRFISSPPSPPYHASRVFGFLAVAYGLPSAREFWNRLMDREPLSSLDQYNRGLALLFTAQQRPILAELVSDLESARKSLRLEDRETGILSACLIVEPGAAGQPPLRLSVWRNTDPPPNRGEDLTVATCIDSALRCLRSTTNAAESSPICLPPLLAELPLMDSAHMEQQKLTLDWPTERQLP